MKKFRHLKTGWIAKPAASCDNGANMYSVFSHPDVQFKNDIPCELIEGCGDWAEIIEPEMDSAERFYREKHLGLRGYDFPRDKAKAEYELGLLREFAAQVLQESQLMHDSECCNFASHCVEVWRRTQRLYYVEELKKFREQSNK